MGESYCNPDHARIETPSPDDLPPARRPALTYEATALKARKRLLRHAASMGIEELKARISCELVPIEEGHTLELMLAELCALDAVRLRDVVAAQFLNAETDEQAGAIEIEGAEHLDFGEPEPDGSDGTARDPGVVESLAARMARLGADQNRPVIPSAELRAEEDRLLKNLLAKHKALRPKG